MRAMITMERKITMGLKTYTFKFHDKEISVKAKKEIAERFVRQIQGTLRVTSLVRELYGVIGVDEHESTMQTLFGSSGVPLADPDGYAADLTAFTAEIPTSFSDPVNIMVWNKRAADLIKEHTPVRDHRKTPEQANADKEASRRFNDEQETKRLAKARDEQVQAATLIKEHPFLTPLGASGKSRWAGGAANMRTELERIFPGVAFSATSETYSMGSSISVKWLDGPTIAQAKEITRKYGTKSFDGMQDLESDIGGVFNDVFGGAGYIHENREISEALLIETAASMGLNFSPAEWREFEACAHQDGESTMVLQNIRNKAHETPTLPTLPGMIERATEARTEAASGVTVRLNPTLNGVEILFKSKPDQSIINALKAHSFRWNRKSRLWYAKQTESRITFACGLQGKEADCEPQADALTEEQDRTGMVFCPSEHEMAT